MTGSRSIAVLSVLGFGYAFLYLPIAILIVYSFNDNRLVAVWSHASLRWYSALVENEQLLNAAWLSLCVAAVSASISVALGSAAAFAID
jgi:putrescine transport system permease protein